MRKLTFLLVASAVLVLAITSVAFATTNSGYVTWNSQGPNAGTAATPHKEFQLTTNKCAVCHAVHKGTAGGEVLLRSSITNACVYCHINNLIGNIKIYGGVEANYNGFDFATAHGGTTYSQCVDCHSVHGANTMAGAVNTKILKMSPGGNSWETTAVNAGLDATAGARQDQITLFCTACHPYFTRTYSTAGGSLINIPATAGYTGFSTAGTYQSHIMTTSGGSLNTYGGSPNYSGQVAWTSSDHCRDCHDAGLIDQSITAVGVTSSNNFPHYVANQSRFLLGALYSGASTATPIGSGEDSAQADGACLKCHRGSATTGVGFDY